ncbi:Ubiquinone biosynthesis O-methyltransferase [subsurface metagenome]
MVNVNKMTYVWPQLQKTEPRGKILFELLKPHLKQKDSFLDVNCGYSPMAKHILESGYSLLGFDNNAIPIEHLKQHQPKGTWHVLSDEQANFKGYSVFILLGITTPLYPVYSSTFLQSVERLLKTNSPRLVLAEGANAANRTLYQQTLKLLTETDRYKCVDTGNYDAQISRGSKRHYSIWLRQWNYPYWQHQFRTAKDEALNGLYEKFISVIGVKLTPLKVYDVALKKIRFPSLPKTKDQFLKKLILEKKGGKSMLIVAFWDARFAFNMGFSGFTVDAIECYKEAVTVANRARATLPIEMRARFNFKYGLAEQLEKHGQYDVIVNYCLEHVRDPKHVMKEALKHLKPSGYAYFTPPIGHGCDSPSHLHYFQEKELHALLPQGFRASIHRVKFQASSPRPNCFIMEVYK